MSYSFSIFAKPISRSVYRKISRKQVELKVHFLKWISSRGEQSVIRGGDHGGTHCYGTCPPQYLKWDMISNVPPLPNNLVIGWKLMTNISICYQRRSISWEIWVNRWKVWRATRTRSFLFRFVSIWDPSPQQDYCNFAKNMVIYCRT